VNGNVACVECLRAHGGDSYLSRQIVPIVIWQGTSLCWTHLELAVAGSEAEIAALDGEP
jgi:hypothetical protein